MEAMITRRDPDVDDPRNEFVMVAENIGDTEVLLTLLNGEVVYEKGIGK